MDSAIELYNALKNKNIKLEDIRKRVDTLPIHSSKDIAIDWTWVTSCDRGRITKLLEKRILNKEIENNKEDIKKCLETED